MSGSSGAGRLQFAVLGPLRVERGGAEVDIGGPRQRLLLAALLLSANRTVSVDRLIDLLWGETPSDRSLPTLHVYVAKLRKALGGGSGVVETVRPGYRINVDPKQVDLLRFDDTSNRARQAVTAGDLDTGAELFRETLEIPRGELLADLADEDLVFQETQAYRRKLATVTADAFDCEIRRGRHTEILGDLERLVIDNPLDERLCGLAMLALYRSGQQTEALAAYRRLRTTLGEELGIEPGPELQDLELKMLNHDPTLANSGMPSRLTEASPTVTRSSRLPATARLEIDGKRIDLRRVVTTIGRLHDQAVVIDDSDVSRRHAEIRRTSEGFVIHDVGSTNGTSVNGERVASHLLASGDEIAVGDTVIVFEELS